LSVGEALVEARIRAGLTTEEVSARSLIRESVIVAMERDDYEACGGPVYVNGYIRAVAAVIGVDPLPLITEYASVQRSSAAPGPGEAPEYDPGTAPVLEPDPGTAGAAAAVPVPGAAPAEEAAPVQGDVPVEGAAPAAEPEPVPDPEPFPEPEPFPHAEPIPGFEPGEPDPSPAPAAETEPATEPVPEPAPVAEPAEFAGPEPARIPITETTLDDLFGYVEPEAVIDPPSPVVSATVPPPAATPPNGIPQVLTESPRQSQSQSQGQGQGRSQGPRPSPANSRPKTPPPKTTRPRSSRPEEPRPVRTRERRRLWLALGSTVVLLAVVGVASTQLVSHANHARRNDATAATQRTTKATSPQPTHAATQPSTKAAAPAITTLTPATAVAFGPAGTSDGDNSNIASLAIDNSASTAWQSNWYATAAFGDLKSGTGLLVDMGSQVTIDQVTILLGAESGATLELKTGDSPSSLSTQATATNAGGQVTLKIKASARYVLLWFTQLPPDGDGTYQVSVYDITCKGRLP
jgi:hypothetical protein